MTGALELATIFRISALLYILMSMTTWLVLRRPPSWPVRLWCLAGILTGISAWLISLRSVLGDVWTYTVAQPVLLCAYLIYGQSLRMQIDRAWSWNGLSVLVVVYAAAIALAYRYLEPWGLSVLVRSTNSAALVALTGAAIMLARHERSRNAYFIAIGFGAFTAIMLTNAMLTWMGQSALHTLQQGWINHVMGLVSLFTVMMTCMGYLGLMLERAQRVNAGLQYTQWQAQQWREMAQALTLFDRQRTLTVLANSLGHGIVQPLTATRLNLQMASMLVQSSPFASDALHAVTAALKRTVEGLHRSASMVERIRGFLQPSPSRPGLLSLQTVLHDAHDLLRQELMYRGTELTVTAPEQAVMVQAELLPLTQALVQVVRNAMDAVQSQSPGRISLVLSVIDNEACIQVTDSGGGLPAKVLQQAGESVQPVVDWLEGLGLYMTKGILLQSGGRLLLDNLPQGGARVRLCLPLAATSAT